MAVELRDLCMEKLVNLSSQGHGSTSRALDSLLCGLLHQLLCIVVSAHITTEHVDGRRATLDGQRQACIN